MVSEEDFNGQVERLIGLGRITPEEVKAALILGASMETDHITRAIELVTERGVVTGSQLHAHLRLDPDDHPSEILAEALADGRLIKEGKEWMLGVGPAQEAEVITYLPTPEAVAAFPQVVTPESVERRSETRPWVQIAVDHLRECQGNRATPKELAVVLGKRGVASFLRHGLITGRLARRGNDWILGEKERMAA